jgi:hypothetical protein
MSDQCVLSSEVGTLFMYIVSVHLTLTFSSIVCLNSLFHGTITDWRYYVSFSSMYSSIIQKIMPSYHNHRPFERKRDCPLYLLVNKEKNNPSIPYS